MITLETIKKLTEIESGIDDISVKSRVRFIIDCRRIYYAISRKHTAYTLKTIGESLKRDYSTVLNSLKNVEHIIKTEENIGYIYNKIDWTIKELKKEKNKFKHFESDNPVMLKKYYESQFRAYTEKYEVKIKELQNRIKQLEK